MNDILQYNDYYASIHYSTNDEVFCGKIIGINDLVSFEGASVKDLKKAFKDAVEDYIETCTEIGKEPNKTYKGSFNVRIPTDLHRQAAIFSAVKNMSLNDFVRYAIDFTLSKSPDTSKVLQTTLMILTLFSPALLAGFLLL